MGKRENIYYVSIAVPLASLAFGLVLKSPLLASLSVLSAAVSLAVYNFWDAIESVAFRHTGMVHKAGKYELMGDRESAVRLAEGRYIATSAALLDPSPKGKITRDDLEGIISRLNVPFRFSVHVEKLDLAGLLDELKTRRTMKELAISRMGASASSNARAKADSLRREIEQISSDIDAVSSGGTPLALAYYLATSAASSSRAYAESEARRNLLSVAGAFDSVTGSRSNLLSGEKLASLLNYDSDPVSV